MIGGAEGGIGTTLILGAWIIGGMGAITEPGGSRTTEAIGGRGMTGTADTTVVRTGGGICGEKGPQGHRKPRRDSQLATGHLQTLRMGLQLRALGLRDRSLTPGSDGNFAERGQGQHSFHLGLNQPLMETLRAKEADLDGASWRRASAPQRPIKPCSPSAPSLLCICHLPPSDLILPHRQKVRLEALTSN